MKKYFFAFCFLVWASVASSQNILQQFIDSIGNKYVAEHHCALIIGVNDNGKEQVFSYSETVKNNLQKPTASDIFEIGQITQVFTSVLYADMTINGIIGADDLLQNYLPVSVPSPVYQPVICRPAANAFGRHSDDDIKNNPVAVQYTSFTCSPDSSVKPQPILLCYLSTHTSGLPDMPSNMASNKKNPFVGYTKENLYDFIRGYSIPNPISADFHYSNLGMALLGHVMELKTNKSYESLLSEYIFSKLNMSDTKVSLSESEKKNFISGYTNKGRPAEYWTFDVMAPCAGLHSDMNDMMKFLSANIGIVNTSLKNILDFTHNPRIVFHDKKSETSYVGLGWFINSLDKEDLNYVWQSGLTGGYASFIGFVETRKTGIVILSNTSVPVDEMGKQILQKIN